ncbi:MAG TPA: hypothetical protein VGJ91_02245 [Polyangiaceae bacterium]|jgi:hypothetical protein
MRRWLHHGWSLIGVAALCASTAGCAAQHDDSLRLSEELGRAHADAAWQAAHAAELEARLSRLEQRAEGAQAAQRAGDRELLSRLDRLIALNERLLAERAAAAPPASGATPSGTASNSAVSSSSAPAARPSVTSAGVTLSQEQELRALVERMRGRPGSPHGGLSHEQEEALRVLTRPERKLDADSPWASAIY